MGMYGGNDPRLEEKADMKQVNKKLADYIQQVRNLGPPGEGDSSRFLDTLRSMENDLQKMKSMYENELEKCRKKLEESDRQKNMALSEIEANKRAAKDFEDRFRCEGDKNRKLMNDINCLQKKVSDLERELANVKSSAQGPQTLLSNMQSDLNREQNKNKQLSNELDKEKTKSKQLEDRVKTLQEKVNFNDELSNEQMKDNAKRLEHAKKVISDLEAKNRELEKQCASIPDALEKMKKKTEQELQKYKDDMEKDNKRNNDTIRSQLNDQSRTIEQLKADNAKLETENQRLMGVLRKLEGQVKDLTKEKAALEEQMRLERSKACEQVRILERKLKELQDQLIDKMQEVNTGRDAQVSLREEIQHAQLLLEMEQNRLNARQNSDMTGNSRGNLSSAASSQYGYTRGGLESSGSDRCGGDSGKLAASKITGRRNEQRTEYQSAHKGRNPYGSYGRSNRGGLPQLGSCRGGASNGGLRCSMPN
ncbi:prelamin-A/C-like isoform X3 [Ruditapes philippinarum]|uniref:prelamin-A/C-like isoform X3 n=1 Tax=Ruditapes philippinarum TaxID=129788 RepID=UPI00295B7FA5|nr:prelamin-A/C-like isoform X3 [Ruditapes philippinarum]